MIQGCKVPNYFADSFWKSLVGKFFALKNGSSVRDSETIDNESIRFSDNDIDKFYGSHIKLFCSVISGEMRDIDKLTMSDSDIVKAQKAGFAI